MFELLFKYSPGLYERSDLIVTSVWPRPVLYAGLVAALLATSGLLIWRRRALASHQLTVIWLLQTAMLSVVFAILLQPALSTERLRPGENSLAIVLDASESMAYGQTVSRFDQAVSRLDDPWMARLSGELAIRRYALAASADPVEGFADSAPTGRSTAIGESLLSILGEARRNPLAGIVLFSDGADTTGDGLTADELAAIAGFGVPVHTVAMGRERIPEDLELADVVMPQQALPGSSVAARVSIRHDRAGTARLKVYDGQDLLASRSVELSGEAAVTSAWVDLDAAEPGFRDLRFTIDRADGEREIRNNVLTRLLEVPQQRRRILYFEGEPRWEYKFLRRAVLADANLAVSTLLRVSPNKFYRQGLDSPDELAGGFPAVREELFHYDGLIIGSVEAASLSAEQQQLIRAFVSERGASLLMLAGPNGLGNGGWGQSVIADVLPTELPEFGTNTFFRRQTPVRLTPLGAGSDMLQLSDPAASNAAAWNGLPPIADYQSVGRLKPAATALLNAKTEKGEQPLLVTQPFGRGHSYILATGGTWRWQMSLPVEDQRHERFWRQLLRALVTDTPNAQSVTVKSKPGGAAVTLRAEFRDRSFKPLAGIGATAVVTDESGRSREIPLRPSPGEPAVFHAEFAPDSSGLYFVEALARRDDETEVLARTGFRYAAGGAEYFSLRLNPGLLRELAQATGGRYFDNGDLAELPELVRYSSSGITEQEIHSIWDAPAVFMLLLLLKSSEWLLRRRWSTL